MADSLPVNEGAISVQDLQRKYQQLVEDYAKVKTQNAVLKKAVLQEQEKNKQLQAEIKQKDIKLRAAAEETDALTFNNQRLTKRVSALQAALEEERAKSSSGGWFGSGAKQELAKVRESLQLVQDELEAKIRENESLHVRIFEERKEHAATIKTLEDKMNKLKSALTKKTAEYDDLQSEHKHTVSKMTAERESLLHHVEELNDTIARTKALMQQREHAMTQVQQKLTADLDAAQKLIQQKILFDDTRNENHNQLNLPAYDRAVQLKREELIRTGLGLAKQTVAALKEIHECEHEKILVTNRNPELPEEIKHLNRKLTNLGPEYLQSFLNFFESVEASLVSNNSQVASRLLESLRQFCVTLKKLSSYRILKLTQEMQLPSSTPEMKMLNESLIANEQAFQNVADKLQTYFTIFYASACPTSVIGSNELQVSKSNLLFILRKIHQCAATFRDLLKDRGTHLSGKIAIDYQLDPFTLPEIKSLNERIITGHSSASSLLDKLVGIMAQYVDTHVNPVRYPVRGVKSTFSNGLYALEPLSDQCKQYLAELNEQIDEAKSIPYEEQLANVQLISELRSKLSEEIHARDTQIEALRAQISTLQKEKSALQMDLTASKDALAAKQSKLSELLAEIADTRQKLSLVSALYQKQLAKARESAPPGVTVDPTTVSIPTPSTPPPPYEEHASLAAHDRTSEPVSSIGGTSPLAHVEPQSATANLISLDVEPQTAHEPPKVQTDLLLLDDTPPATPAIGAGTEPVPSIGNAVSLLSASDLISAEMSASPAHEGAGGVSGQVRWSMVVMDEGGNQSSKLNFTLEDKEREMQLKKYYEEKYKQLRSQLDLADKKGLELYQQKCELEAALAIAIKERDDMQQQIITLQQLVSHSKEEVDTTRDNYEAQLKVLTEHLVQLNEKIGAYEDELSMIKNCTVCCGKCKTWNRVGWLLTEGKNGQRCSKGNHPSSFNYA